MQSSGNQSGKVMLPEIKEICVNCEKRGGKFEFSCVFIVTNSLETVSVYCYKSEYSARDVRGRGHIGNDVLKWSMRCVV